MKDLNRQHLMVKAFFPPHSTMPKAEKTWTKKWTKCHINFSSRKSRGL